LKKFLPDIGFTIVFGILSIILGIARFPVPGPSEVYSDLREIPLLIAVFHIQHPVFLVLLSLVTAASSLFYEGGYFSSTFFMHVGGLVLTWYFYRFFISEQNSGFKTSIYWYIWIVIYYVVLVIPIMIFVDIWLMNDQMPFLEAYPLILSSISFETISTFMVTLFYLLQLQAKQDIKKVNLTLEDRINERTIELNRLNEELRFSHEEIMKLNENLEHDVIERTAKLRIQLEKLNAYAFANSHDVRGPLARMLGLLQLIDMEKEIPRKVELFAKINEAARELDEIIRKMNRILESENLIDYD
jgi:signal transduction histidine kinase